MNRFLLYTIFLVTICSFTSCEERIGYYDDDQKEIIALLTGKEWRMVYEKYPNFEPVEYNGEGLVYKFNENATGYDKWINWDDGKITGEPIYFRWTFTTDNFSVLYIDKEERFWLIDRLTSTELWVYSTHQDPVLYPNTDKIFYKFVGNW